MKYLALTLVTFVGLFLAGCSSGGYDDGYNEGLKDGATKVISCVDACNAGTGVVNECYDLDCVNGCITGSFAE